MSLCTGVKVSFILGDGVVAVLWDLKIVAGVLKVAIKYC